MDHNTNSYAYWQNCRGGAADRPKNDRGSKSRFRPYNNWRGRGRGRGNRNNSSKENRSGYFNNNDYLMPTATPRVSNPEYSPGLFRNPRNPSWGRNVLYRATESNSVEAQIAYESFGNSSFEIAPYDVPSPHRKQLKIDQVIASQMAQKYPGYLQYFPSTMSSIENVFEKLTACTEYLTRKETLPNLNAAYSLEDKEYFEVHYEHLVDDDKFIEAWPSFDSDLHANAEDVMNIFGLSMQTLMLNVLKKEDTEDKTVVAEEESFPITDTSNVQVPYIHARLLKLTPPLTPIKSIRSTTLGKFVTVRGAVIRTGTVKPYCSHMTFRCADCLKAFVAEQLEGRCTMPTKCPSPECRSKTFEPLEKEKTTQFSLARVIRLQDIQHDGMERGSVPRSIDCRLGNTLQNLCNAGDAVTICGVVKFHHESGGGFGALDQQLHNFYIDVIAIKNHKDCDRTMGGNWFTFSNKDYYAVQEIHDSKNLFRLLVASLCPTIFGHDLVKAGLLLSLFGGSAQSKDSIISRRSDINVLVVGDPGIGKSQMLSVVCDVAPRGVYVCGTATTVAGLTVTLVKDGDDYSLEAGALVMGDRGVCCIDEFDKMQAQHHALLEAMEQQSISIAKSGVFRTLPARTSVIAAANPVGGHYNPRKSVAENIRINPALLSRFDLTFILVDRSDEETDRNVVNHILGMRLPGANSRSQPHISIQNSSSTGDLTLRQKLQFATNDEVDLIPHHLLRKYIAYARQYVSPMLSPEASEMVKKYYLNLRSKHRTVNTMPVTTRQLESILRLTQARAKLELREVATEQDAKDVLEIFEFGMASVFEDDIFIETSLSQLSGSSMGTQATSKRSHTKGMAKKLLGTLQELSNRQCKNIFTIDEIKQTARALGIGNGVETLVSALNNEGFLLNKGGKVYQLQSADF